MLTLVPYQGKALRFNTRQEPGHDGADTDWIVLCEMFTDNAYQLDEQDLGEKGVVLDIGANIGAFSIQAAVLGAKEIIAVEPDIDNYILLCENIKENGLEDMITAINYAVAPEPGKRMLKGSQGGAHLAEDGSGGSEISCLTLESLFKMANCENIDVLKMDIEGGEYGLFESVPDEVLRRVNYLKIEFHGATVDKFGSMMARLSCFFNMHLFGHYDTGGYIYGQRY